MADRNDATGDHAWREAGGGAVGSTRGPGTTPSVAVVEAVAAATGRDPTALPPLAEHVDPDALDDLLERGAADDGSPVGLTFQYAGSTVAIDSAGVVEVRDPDEPSPPPTKDGFHEGP